MGKRRCSGHRQWLLSVPAPGAPGQKVHSERAYVVQERQAQREENQCEGHPGPAMGWHQVVAVSSSGFAPTVHDVATINDCSTILASTQRPQFVLLHWAASWRCIRPGCPGSREFRPLKTLMWPLRALEAFSGVSNGPRSDCSRVRAYQPYKVWISRPWCLLGIGVSVRIALPLFATTAQWWNDTSLFYYPGARFPCW